MCLESTIFYYFAAWCVAVAMPWQRVDLPKPKPIEASPCPLPNEKSFSIIETMKLDSKPSLSPTQWKISKGSQSFLLNSDQRIADLPVRSIFWFSLELFLQSYKELIAALAKGQW